MKRKSSLKKPTEQQRQNGYTTGKNCCEHDDHSSQRKPKYRVLWLALCACLALNLLLGFVLFRRPFTVIHEGITPSTRGEQNVCLPCAVTQWHAMHALNRVKTSKCRNKLLKEICSLASQRSETECLKSRCPLSDSRNFKTYLGCYTNFPHNRIINEHWKVFDGTNTPKKCANYCLLLGYSLSGVQYQSECFCGNNWTVLQSNRRVDDSICRQYNCLGEPRLKCGGLETLAVYNTGFGKQPRKVVYDPLTIAERENYGRNTMVPQLVFLFQLNGRNVRQVRRLIKNTYRHNKHYYYVHVDSKQEYLYQGSNIPYRLYVMTVDNSEMLKVEQLLGTNGNFRVKRNRHLSIWGGQSLLRMLIDSLKDVLGFNDWKWDAVINLSESDFPVAPIEELEMLLIKYPGKSFLGSADNIGRFIAAQGLDKVFVECERRMWLIGERLGFPRGMTLDGGSDWYTLNRRFVEYVVGGTDDVINSIRRLFSNTLIPKEAFFHTVAANSEFCGDLVNQNNRYVHWNRQRGCKCNRAHIDWCGCRPNVIRINPDANETLSAFIREPGIVFARKFDSFLDQTAIAEAEHRVSLFIFFAQKRIYENVSWLPGRNNGPAYARQFVASAVQPWFSKVHSHRSFTSVWLNYFHHLDKPPILLAQAVLLLLWHRCLREIMTPFCTLNDAKELNIFRPSDNSPYAILTKYSLMCNGRELIIESLFAVRNRQKIRAEQSILNGYSLSDVAVGVNFDSKEGTFHDSFGVIRHVSGSNITARLLWQVHTPLRTLVTLRLINPDGVCDSVYRETLHGRQSLHIHATNLIARHTTSGVWRCRVFIGEQQRFVGETAFLVLPLLDQQLPRFDGPISSSQLRHAYPLRHICVEQPMVIHALKMSTCGETGWSTLSPDPKSDVIAT